MSPETFAELVEQAAKARGEAPVPRARIIEAIRRIEDGLEQVTRYPGGAPSLKDVYDVAARLAGVIRPN